jgi:nitroimidazol reductase NimA-like FMN-containing flavoprotein (pyridoxamine 5'-phosphate oxidase superfamily)
MYKEMRRKDRQASREDAVRLLQNCEYGILATSDNSNQPYAVPVNFVYIDDCIYFHCAKEGQKLDNIKANSAVSFCLVGDSEVLPDKFSTAYQSTIVFGISSIVDDIEERYKVLHGFIDKYSKEFQQSGNEYIDKAAAATCVVKIKINHITGKQRIK